MKRAYFITSRGLVCGFCGMIQSVVSEEGELKINENHWRECAPEMFSREELEKK